jgi:hypothetical protein
MSIMADSEADFKPELRAYLNGLYGTQGIGNDNITAAIDFMSHYTGFPAIPGNPAPREKLRVLERIHLNNLGLKLD